MLEHETSVGTKLSEWKWKKLQAGVCSGLWIMRCSGSSTVNKHKKKQERFSYSMFLSSFKVGQRKINSRSVDGHIWKFNLKLWNSGPFQSRVSWYTFFLYIGLWTRHQQFKDLWIACTSLKKTCAGYMYALYSTVNISKMVAFACQISSRIREFMNSLRSRFGSKPKEQLGGGRHG